MIDKLIFLYSFNGGELEESFSPKSLPISSAINFLLNDSYLYLLKLLVAADLVKNVFIISKCREKSHRYAGYGTYKVSEGVEIIFPPNLKTAESYIGPISKTDIIWSRGTAYIWTNFLKKYQNTRKILYNLAYLNTDPLIYDIVFMDEDCQFKKIKQHPNSYELNKPCDETIFFPTGDKKIYDVISVGTICERKGQLRVIRAAKKLKRPMRLLFPGVIRDENYLNKCIAAAKGSDLSLEFPGVVNRNELNNYINKSYLHVLSSRNEQAPRVLIEVACVGVPSLITHRIGGGKNYINEKTGGICHEWRLASNMKTALDLWSKPVREGYLESFSAKMAVDKIKAAFGDIGWN